MRSFSYLTAATAAYLAAPAEAADKAKECCDALSAELADQVFLPNTEVYEERLNSIWSASARQAPWCVVLPENTEDTSSIMKIVSSKQCNFGIRSGGHGTTVLSNSVEDGVTIDFGRMNGASYDAEKGIVSIEPGIRSANAYDKIHEYGVSITAGRVGDVGVSGFITGGGNSYHAQTDGWACDNVINFEIVLADGSVVNANAEENSDLWQAFRGSSGNLGLVTRFDMKAIPLPDPEGKMYGGIVTWDPSVNGDAIETYVDFAENVVNDPATSIVIWFEYYSDVGDMGLLAVIDNVENVGNATQVQKFLNFGGVTRNTLRSDTEGNLARELNGLGNLHNHHIVSAFDNDAEIIRYSQEKHEELIDVITAALPEGTFFYSKTEYQPITKQHNSRGNGPNILGLEKHVDSGVGLMFLYYIAVETPEAAEIVFPIAQKYHEEINAYATERGINWDWEYLAYAHHYQDPISKYGEENIKKLQAASKKYDPKGVFQNLRGSGFKIPA